MLALSPALVNLNFKCTSGFLSVRSIVSRTSETQNPITVQDQICPLSRYDEFRTLVPQMAATNHVAPDLVFLFPLAEGRNRSQPRVLASIKADAS